MKIQEVVDSAGTSGWRRTVLLVQVWYSGLGVTGAGLVAAVVGFVVLVQEGSRWCRKLATAAGRWSLVQEGSRWCRTSSCCGKIVAGAALEGTRFDFRN